MQGSKHDILVVGLGIAGACLCHELERRGLSFRVVDAADADAASGVAPGVINPLAGKRLNPSWRVEEQLPAALEVYHEMEAVHGVPLMHHVPIIRIIKDEEQREYLQRRLKNPASAQYIGVEHGPGRWPGLLRDPLGSFDATVSGYLDVAAACRAARARYRAMGLLVEERLDGGELRPGPCGVVWRGERFGKAVFCEGWRGRGNPWFAELPFKPAKGEMLTLRPRTPLEGFPAAIVNRSKWLLPIGDGLFRAGSTYSWDSFDEQPTEAGRREILNGLREFVDAEFDVVEHQAGVRPILKDYRPALGTHPDNPSIVMFNGLGSKGVLAAPWLARRLLAHLLDGEPIYEMDVRRLLRRQ